MKYSILLTGSTGFIGSHVLNFLLKKNISVCALVRKKKQPKKKKIFILFITKKMEKLKKNYQN